MSRLPLYDKWDLRFLSLAKHVAAWSLDPSTKVGAVIADPYNRVTGVGFNGFARGVQDMPERLENKELKYQMVLHAEENVLAFASKTFGCTLYAGPLPICPHCMSQAIQHGIARVVMPKISLHQDSKWKPGLSMVLAGEAGVIWSEIDFDWPRS